MKSKVLEGKRSGAAREWSPLELAEVKTPRRIGSIWRAKGATSRRRIKFDDRDLPPDELPRKLKLSLNCEVEVFGGRFLEVSQSAWPGPGGGRGAKSRAIPKPFLPLALGGT